MKKMKNTNIKFQLRSGPSKRVLDSNIFVGPDGSPCSFYTQSGSPIWSGHNGDIWIQYKAYLITENQLETPYLNNVTISYNTFPTLDPISVKLVSNDNPNRFNITVKYFDKNNDPPSFVRVWINGDNYSMVEVDIDDNNFFDG